MLVFLMAVCVPMMVSADEPGPAKDVPELKVLQNYVGTWDVKVAGDEVANGENTARWILGGRFLEQSGFIVSENGTNRVEVTTLYTYDTTKKAYRSWSFLSTGNTSQADMTWDARTKTMTSVEPNEFKTTSQHGFPNSGKCDWKVLIQDTQGTTMFRMEGTSLRVNGPKP